MTRKRLALLLGAGVAALLLLALSMRTLLQPDRVSAFVLDSLGRPLGLAISAGADSQYRLRGTPQLVLRKLDVREPGAATPLLRAQRMLVAVPWSTLRSRGERLDITRIELDAPVLDLAALRHWLATRPPGKTRLPTLRDGLRIRDGRIDGGAWRIDGIALALPRLHPARRVDARVAGRYRTGTFALRFEVAAAMTRPANDAGVAIVGALAASDGHWRLPVQLKLSAPLHFGDDGVRSRRLRAAAAARYESGHTRLPFAFAIASPLLLRNGTLALAPAGIALRGDGAIANLDARGALAYGKRLLLQLDGRLAGWPAAWPALPPPLGASHSPLPFALHYLGDADLSGIATLQLQRDGARFDARLRIPDISAWAAADSAGAPLPPLQGRLRASRLDISGALLEGVEVRIDDPALPPPAASP